MDRIFLSPHPESYEKFPQEKLPSILKRIFSVLKELKNKETKIQYISLEVIPPTFTEEECLKLRKTYSAQLRLHLNIEQKEENQTTTSQKAFTLGYLPLFTPRDSLIIDGLEQVPVAQLLPYPGVYFELTEDREYIPTWKVTIRPLRGGHLRFIVQGPKERIKAYTEVGFLEGGALNIKKRALKVLVL